MPRPLRPRLRLAPAILAAIAPLAAPGCHQDGGARPAPGYRVRRPPAPTPAVPIRPVRIGGYAGYNYGPTPPPEPVAD